MSQPSNENEFSTTPKVSPDVQVSSSPPVPASLDPLQELAALRPERSDFVRHAQRAQRRLRKAAFTRSHYSAHGQVRESDFPDYSLPQNDLRQQSVAIGGLEIRQSSGVDDRIHRPITAGDGLSISMPVRMGGNFLPLRDYATAEATPSTQPNYRLPLMRSNTDASIGSIATTGHLATSVGNERRTSDFWWQFPGFLSSNGRNRRRTSRPNAYGGIHDGTSICSDSDMATQNDLDEQHDYTSTDDREGEDNGYDDYDEEEEKKKIMLLMFTPIMLICLAIPATMPLVFHGILEVPVNLVFCTGFLVATLINVLGAVSYGMIIFPSAVSIFSDFALDGVALYLISSIVSQVVYSAGGSAFPGAVGGMILEVAPFLHAIAFRVMEELGDQDAAVVTATTMVAYALSAIVTGVFFFLMGYFKLGSLIGFFPRHILVGCIGGVGWFLLQTGFEVVCGVNLEHDAWSKSNIGHIIANATTSNESSAYRADIPILHSYRVLLVAGIFGLSMDELRQNGWLFKLPSPMKPFYEVYQRYDFTNVQWSVLPKTFPAMLALTFFSILHVPINVPALSVTIAQDGVDLSHELLAHGISNILAGLCGSVQNYLVYSNSVLFIKCGGNSRVAGVALALCTLAAFFIVASLIFHLGIELLKEALYHPWGRVHPLEYATMVAIILSMAAIGFIEGVLVGGFLACVFFVVLYSQRRAVRRWLTGGPGGARSAVRRPVRQRQYLDELGEQLHLFELQGFLFFGTVNALEETIERIVTGHITRAIDQSTLATGVPSSTPTSGTTGPIARFIIMDFSLVTGIDFSAAEALVRVKRVLAANDVCLVVAGVAADSEIGQALRSVGLWGGTRLDVYVQNARTAQQAVEWCENQLLKCYYDHAEELQHALRPPTSDPIQMILNDSQQGDGPETDQLQLGLMTPRTEMIAEAARYLLPDDTASLADEHSVNSPRALLCMALARDLRSSMFPLRDSIHASSDNEQQNDFEAMALNTIAAAFKRCFFRRDT
ncbi:sulfate transporter family-domain-containing protein [Syncephalis plumigaleata]|nr:sulfate transporter family-domain-containing protein [Syncephalis plumigaleata]